MSLVPTFTLGDLVLTDYPFAVEFGTDYGAPQNVYEVVQSLLVDGDLISSPRAGNRTLSVTVLIEGADLAELASAERTLLLECEKWRNTFTVDPGDGYAEMGVFRTFRAQVVQQPSEDLERANLRRYQITMQAEPFVRAADPVTTTLTYGSDAGTVLDDSTSTTGWSSTDGTLSAVTVNAETAVKLTLTTPAENAGRTLTRAALALTAAKPYLAVDVAVSETSGTAVSAQWLNSVSVKLGSTSLGAAVAAVPQANGFTRFVFSHALAGTTQDVHVAVYAGAITLDEVYVGNVMAYSTAPGSGLMVADVEGSERAPVTVKLARISNTALGKFFIYSDPSMLEYGWNPGDPSTWANAPAGSYVLVNPIPGLSTTLYSQTINGQVSKSIGGLSSALFFDFQLGARRDGKIGTISPSYSGSGMFLFRDEPGVTALVQLSDVTGRYLFVDSPTIESPQIGVWSGSASDGSDAVSLLSYAESLDPLTAQPPRFALFIKGYGMAPADDFTATLAYYPQFHTFVAPKGLVL